MRRGDKIVRESRVPWGEENHGKDYVIRRKPLAYFAGGEKLGCSLYELPPGKRSWPYHFHCANEEAIYVLEGSGTLRLAGKKVPLRQGDYVSLPADPSGAHQVINTSRKPLRYLCLSTMAEPDIAVYPDTGKIGLFAGSAPGSRRPRILFTFLRGDAKVGYWEDEE